MATVVLDVIQLAALLAILVGVAMVAPLGAALIVDGALVLGAALIVERMG